MSLDPAGPAPETPDTPTTPAADTPEIDYRKRYDDLQPEYTRKAQALAEHERIWEDEHALLARIAEKFPALLAEEDPEDIDDEPVATTDPQIETLTKQQQEFLAWQQSVEAERRAERFAKDLASEAGDREVSDKAREWILQRTIATGNNRDALGKAAKEWFEFEDSLRAQAAPKQRARVPHVPAGGTPPGDVVDTTNMTRQELERYMLDRYRAESA